MAVTLKDLAAMSGCSIRTVNRVIWRSGPVAEAKRLRIEALLREHHYVPNMAARNLKQSRRNFAGIIINGGTTVQIFLRKLSALVNRLGDQGFYPLLGHPVADAVRLEQLLGEWTGLVQHVIFMYMPPAEILEHLPLSSHRFGMHFTVLDAMGDLPSEVSGLRIDRGAGIFEAISQLCARGHRRILRLGNVSSRDDGWKAAREHFSGTVEFSHLPVQPECEVAAELGDRIFAGHPDAVFCDTDRAASGVLRAAAAAGLSVPADFSLVGFDDDPMASMLTPRLSSVSHPLDELNAAAVAIVSSGQSVKAADRSFPARFVLRESVKTRN